MENSIKEDISPEILANRRAGILLVKFVLYAIFLGFFVCAGLMLGAGTVSYNQEILFREQMGGNPSSISEIFTSKLILLSLFVFLPLSVLAIYLTHKFQRRLSSMAVSENKGWLWADWCFTVLNSIVFCFSVFSGFVGAILSISFQMGPD